MVPPTASCSSNRTAGGAGQPHRRPIVKVSTHQLTYERQNELFRRDHHWHLFPDSQPPDDRAMTSGFCALDSPSLEAQIAPEKRQQLNVSRRKSPIVFCSQSFLASLPATIYSTIATSWTIALGIIRFAIVMCSLNDMCSMNAVSYTHLTLPTIYSV